MIIPVLIRQSGDQMKEFIRISVYELGVRFAFEEAARIKLPFTLTAAATLNALTEETTEVRERG